MKHFFAFVAVVLTAVLFLTAGCNNRKPEQRLSRVKPVHKLSHVTVPNNFTTIEEAYRNVKEGGIITIQPGKYELSETLIVDKSVTFRGSTGHAEDVVIDCPSSTAFCIIGGSPSFQNITVSSGAEQCGGFSISSGTPKLFRCVVTSRKGTGIYVSGLNTNPQVESCTIKDCGETGVFVYEKGSGSFIDCEIYGNALAGIEVKESGNPTVTKCKIHNGKQGGVLVWINGLGKFDDCEIYGNTLSGIEVRESGNPTVTGCNIHDGKGSGVYVYKDGMGTFNNNTLKNNYYNWNITSDAGEVEGSGNSPSMSSR